MQDENLARVLISFCKMEDRSYEILSILQIKMSTLASFHFASSHPESCCKKILLTLISNLYLIITNGKVHSPWFSLVYCNIMYTYHLASILVGLVGTYLLENHSIFVITRNTVLKIFCFLLSSSSKDTSPSSSSYTKAVEEHVCRRHAGDVQCQPNWQVQHQQTCCGRCGWSWQAWQDHQ